MAVYVVTGGGGFIGSHIVEELIRRGETTKVIDNFSTGKRENVAPFKNDAEIIEADIAEAKNLQRFYRCRLRHSSGSNTFGAQIHTRSDEVPPCECERTLNVLLACRDAGVKRVVYASSSSLYGDSPTLPKHEGMMPNPLSPYGAQKLFGEMYCKVFTKAYGLETVSLRYFNVFGPRQDSTSQYSGVLALFIPAVLQNRRPTIYGDGLQSRDFTYVQNVVEANLLACEATGVAGQAFNIACGDRITLNSMLQQINSITGKEPFPDLRGTAVG